MWPCLRWAWDGPISALVRPIWDGPISALVRPIWDGPISALVRPVQASPKGSAWTGLTRAIEIGPSRTLSNAICIYNIELLVVLRWSGSAAWFSSSHTCCCGPRARASHWLRWTVFFGTVFQTRVVSHVVGICMYMYVYYIYICIDIIFNIKIHGCVCVTVYILQMWLTSERFYICVYQ